MAGLYVYRAADGTLTPIANTQGDAVSKFVPTVDYSAGVVLISETLTGSGEVSSAQVTAPGVGVVQMVVGSNSSAAASVVNSRLMRYPVKAPTTSQYMFDEARSFGAWNQSTREFYCDAGDKFKYYCSTPTGLFVGLIFFPMELVKVAP